MTEKYWQQEKIKNNINKNNVHPIIQQTYKDKKALEPNKNFRELYYKCLQGALFLKQWGQSDNLTINDMGMLICRDIGCELQYCQASIADPNETPFNSCDEHFKRFTNCMTQEIRRYIYDGQGRTMQEQVAYMLEKRNKEKYEHLMEEKQKEVINTKKYLEKPEEINVVLMNEKL